MGSLHNGGERRQQKQREERKDHIKCVGRIRHHTEDGQKREQKIDEKKEKNRGESKSEIGHKIEELWPTSAL